MGQGDENNIDALGETIASAGHPVDPLTETAESGERIKILSTPGAGDIDEMGETVATPNPDALRTDAATQRLERKKRRVETGKPALTPGDKLGRYVVLDLLGAGGMGEVYAAYDPELDRRIALKVIHPGVQYADTLTVARGRLLREAKSMAKLSHPNVISVFDVGTLDDDVYVAMEYIDGQDLRHWSKAEQRAWTEVVEVYAAAGRGLAAAHDAGMVHRDFKPDNVLIGSDGRVRVIDFGLAAKRDADDDAGATREAKAPSHEHESLIEESRAGKPDAVTTQAGSVLGTPAYMAPEQFDGADTDTRTDQFNFAVALYESLYNERPFAGDDYTTLASNVTRGNRRPVPKTGDAPTWLQDVLARCLSKDPKDRYDSMHDVVDALAPPETFWRRHRAAIASALGVALIGGALAAQVLMRDSGGQACVGLDRDLTGVWDESRKSDVRKAILATNLPYAKDVWTRVDNALDGYTERWVAARVDACEDSAIRKEQSQEMLGLRMDCLDRRLHELDAVVTVIAAADDNVVTNAAQVAASLTPVDRCSNKALLANRGDDADAKAVDRDLARVKALDAAGKYQDAYDLAQQTLERVRKLPARPREANALTWTGRMQFALGNSADAIEILFEAVRVADKAGEAEAEARAWVSIVGITSAGLGRAAEAERWIEHARLAIEQAGGGDLELQAKLHHQTGIVYFDQKRYAEALPEFRAAAALYERAQGKSFFRTALSVGMAASTLRRLHRNDEAATVHMEALHTLEEALGPEHPRVASMLNNVANTLSANDKLEEAKAYFERSLSIKRKTVGPDHHSIASTLVNLGGLEERMGHWDDAIARYQHALDIRNAQLKADNPAIPRTMQAIARVHRKMGELKLALQQEKDVLLRYESIYGADHERTNNVRVALCDVLLRTKQLVAAERECAHAVKSLETAPDQRNLAWALTYAGRVALAMNKPPDAVEALERAMRIRDEFPSTKRYLAETKFVLAAALAANHKDPDRATTLATEAKEILDAGPIGDAEFLPEIDAFLAKRGN